MKQLPRILPRSSIPDKTSSLPLLAPIEPLGVDGASAPGGPAAAASGAGVKVIAMATLPQQQGGPVPLMILPQACLSYEREVAPPPPSAQQLHAPAAPISVLQKAQGNANKRPLEVTPGNPAGVSAPSTTGSLPVKRKRGRPRKPRPEDSLPPPSAASQPPPPAPSPHPPIITSVTGGVIQKAASSSSAQPVLELVIQDQQGLVLSPLPTVSEHRGVVVQCQPGGAVESDHHPRSVLLFQNPSWELAGSGRTQMVEVIQKAPRPSNNNSSTGPLPAHLHPPPIPLLPTLPEEQGEVEITLTPVDLNVTPTLPPSTFSSLAALASSSSISSTIVVKEEEEEEGDSSSGS